MPGIYLGKREQAVLRTLGEVFKKDGSAQTTGSLYHYLYATMIGAHEIATVMRALETKGLVRNVHEHLHQNGDGHTAHIHISPEWEPTQQGWHVWEQI